MAKKVSSGGFQKTKNGLFIPGAPGGRQLIVPDMDKFMHDLANKPLFKVVDALLASQGRLTTRSGRARKSGGIRFQLPVAGLCTSYKAEMFDGIHQAADVYNIALYTSAANIGVATTAYTATGEVATGGGYTAGGIALAGRQIVTDGTTVIQDWTTDPVWAAATITARGAMIYNSTRANRAMIVLDFGSDVTSTNGNFTVTLPAPTAAAGLIRLA